MALVLPPRDSAAIPTIAPLNRPVVNEALNALAQKHHIKSVQLQTIAYTEPHRHSPIFASPGKITITKEAAAGLSDDELIALITGEWIVAINHHKDQQLRHGTVAAIIATIAAIAGLHEWEKYTGGDGLSRRSFLGLGAAGALGNVGSHYNRSRHYTHAEAMIDLEAYKSGIQKLETLGFPKLDTILTLAH